MKTLLTLLFIVLSFYSFPSRSDENHDFATAKASDGLATVLAELTYGDKQVTVTRGHGITIIDGEDEYTLFDMTELICGAFDKEGNLWIGGTLAPFDAGRPTISRYDWKEWMTWDIGDWIQYIDVDENNVVHCSNGNSTKSYIYDGVTWQLEYGGVKTANSNTRTAESMEITVRNSDYFPLALGNTWIYQREFRVCSNPVIYHDHFIKTIIDVRQVDGKTEYEFLDGRVYTVNENGVIENLNYELRPCGEIECDDGMYWTSNFTRRDYTDTVPAGTFDGYRFSYGEHVLTYSFYSPAIGLVSRQLLTDNNEREDLKLERALVNGVEIGLPDEIESTPAPEPLSLSAPFPNPFNSSTTIEFTLPKQGETSLTAYTVNGQKVRTLLSGSLATGNYAVIWDSRDENGRTVSSGVYLLRLETGGHAATARLAFVK